MSGMLFGFIKRKVRHLYEAPPLSARELPDDDAEIRVPEIALSLEESLSDLRRILGDDSDLIVHRFRFGPNESFDAALLYYDGLVNQEVVTDALLRPVLDWRTPDPAPKKEELAATLDRDVLHAGDVKRVEIPLELASACLSGDACVLLDGCPEALVVSARGWDKRSVTEPASETVVRGPREGFTENLRTNTALIRRKIKSGRLRSELLTIGEKTMTAICLMYLEGVADPNVLEKVKYRLKRLKVDSILESGYIEEYIGDAPFSPFSTVGFSEKPDVIAAKVLEGRVAIVVDGTPFVLTVPLLFVESFQTAEDYYQRTIYASTVRLLRYVAYFLAVFAPAIYIALTTFHQELIPTTLLFTIANAREGTPFPVFLEALIMVFAFEILREGGIRLPRPVGQSISIVGALIMGDAAVSAGIVGAPVVITVAITAVAGFLVPSQSDSASILRFLLMLAAAFMGFYGIAFAFLAVMIHLSTLDSFGVPFFDGFAWTRNLQDSVIRMPLWTMVKRPKGIAQGDVRRRRFFFPSAHPFAADDNGEDDA